jgi:hypothetical protein
MSLEKCFDDFLNLPQDEQERRVANVAKQLKLLAKNEYKGAFRDLVEERIMDAPDCSILLKILKGFEVLARPTNSHLHSVLELVEKRIKQLDPEPNDIDYTILFLQYLPNLKSDEEHPQELGSKTYRNPGLK